MGIEYIEGKCFLGKTLTLANDAVEVQVTLDVGPRIISYKKIGGENVMFCDNEDKTKKDVSETFSPHDMWHLYGGHRLWAAPENKLSYYPDNTKVPFAVATMKGALFIPDMEAVSGLSKELKVELMGGTKVRVTNKITNKNKKTVEISAWALTALRPSGRLSVALDTKNTGLLPNRNLVFWSYCSMFDERFKLSDKEASLVSSEGARTPFKFGLFNKNIVAKYQLDDGTVFVKRVAAEEGEYPDFCCNFESYTNNLFCEVETLSPKKILLEGESVTLVEDWSLE